MIKPLLQVRNLKKIFGKGCSHCLSENLTKTNENRCPVCNSIIGCTDINFRSLPGEILGIVGESGSGKSTILNSLYFNFDVTLGEAYYSPLENDKKIFLLPMFRQKETSRTSISGSFTKTRTWALILKSAAREMSQNGY